MTDIGIKAYGAYIPRLRMDRAAIAAAHAWVFPGLKAAGKGERAFGSWDEDSITMSVDALRACLRGGLTTPVKSLTFASTTAVFSGRGPRRRRFNTRHRRLITRGHCSADSRTREFASS
jgi:hydroxymethylglutaryl-CoA synthase